MCFLFGEVSSSSGCLGWATLFYCGTPWAFHLIILLIVEANELLHVYVTCKNLSEGIITCFEISFSDILNGLNSTSLYNCSAQMYSVNRFGWFEV